MKAIRLIFTAAFFLIALLTYGQNGTGMLVDTLQEMYKNPAYYPQLVKDGDYLIFRVHGKSSMAEFFINQVTRICTATIIYPRTKEVRDRMIKEYNENYQQISNMQWEVMTSDTTFVINLFEEGLPLYCRFVWKFKKDSGVHQ